MNKLPSYNLDPTANDSAADVELNLMFLVPLLDTGFETSILGCGCGRDNGCGSGTCLCGSQNGGGGGVCP